MREWKMFKLHRQRSHEKLGERVDFKFSQLQALQVPRGWDKLFVSIISVETGKAVAKSNKSVVRNGNCQWTEVLSETIWVSQDDTSRVLEERPFRLVVATGSARSGILGEVNINLTDYMTSKVSAPELFPLKKCNYGTLLQVKIQCPTQRPTYRGKHGNTASIDEEDQISDYEDADSKSEGSDNYVGSNRSSFNHLGGVSQHGDLKTLDMSSSASGSHHSSDGGEGSLSGLNLFSRNNSNGDMISASASKNAITRRQDSTGSQNGSMNQANYGEDIYNSTALYNTLTRRQDSTGSQNGSMNHANYGETQHNSSASINTLARRKDSTGSQNGSLNRANYGEDLYNSNSSSFNSKGMGSMSRLQNKIEDFPGHSSPRVHVSSSLKNSDSSKGSLEAPELTVEELRSQAMMWERNAHKLEFELESQRKALSDQSRLNTDMDMDNVDLRAERDSLKLEIEQIKSRVQESTEKQKVSDGATLKELKEEINFQKRSNSDLSSQLMKTQESNIELVSILQELEETVEKQKLEIETLSAQRNVLPGPENCGLSHLSVKVSEESSEKLAEIVEIEREKKRLEVQLQELEDSKERLQSVVESLETKLEEMDQEIQQERKLKNQTVMDVEEKWALKMSALEDEIVKLQTQVSNLLSIHPSSKISGELGHDKSDLFNEIESLRRKVQELEKDCSELTDENLDLIVKLNEAKKDAMKPVDNNETLREVFYESDSLSTSVPNKGSESEVGILKSYIFHLEQQLEKGHNNGSGVVDLVVNIQNEDSKSKCQLKEELEDLVLNLRKENEGLKESYENALRDNSITSKCLDDVRHDLRVLTSSLESHVSVRKSLEKKLLDLESEKGELEAHLSELEEENVNLSERISGLEAQVRYLTEERESGKLELQISRSRAANLQSDIERLKLEMEKQINELRQTLQDGQKEASDAQEEVQYLKREKYRLEATFEALVKDCDSLQKMNVDMKMQKLELHEHYAELEGRLRKKLHECSSYIPKIEYLEMGFSSMQREVASKDQSFSRDLEAFFSASKEHNEKLMAVESLCDQMLLEKTIEVDHLRSEVERLTTVISSTDNERRITETNTLLEVSSLREDKLKLESSLEEAHEKVKWLETELSNIRHDSSSRAQELLGMLSDSKQKEEAVMADYERIKTLLDEVKSSDGNSKRMANELEIMLRASENEKQKLKEESDDLTAQLERLINIRDEFVALKCTLDEMRLEKSRMEASLKFLSTGNEQMKVEKLALMEKIRDMQKAVSEGEDAKHSKIALEEKILRLECDLTAKDALSVHEAEMRNELGRMKRVNSQFLRKIQYLEEEKDGYLRRAQVLEEELKLEDKVRNEELNTGGSSTKDSSGLSEHDANYVYGLLERIRSLEYEMKMNADDYKKKERHLNMKIEQLQNFHHQPSMNQQNFVGQCEREDHNPLDGCRPLPQEITKGDYICNGRFLETESDKFSEENKQNDVQLQNSLPEDTTIKSLGAWIESENELGEKHGDKMKSLEMELKDLRDRYLHMSLRFAQVEVEREELVMTVKNLKSGKRWFS
ncbi:golgin subfamily A member 4 isoform X2 [Amborella trichopoda]|uniref:golgin subfamily A member 4 isoform X2 n=1 Tax=Amborella trichopoda TaxID=13333 RepID=UPI0009BEE79C|nr:golgin subfamily A member 4 isoform X2 [Amborella trichopoda]|eukprot:XP_020522108.1 golgin subfamily A member 4 isoform X2 [Amborella trichopoda]